MSPPLLPMFVHPNHQKALKLQSLVPSTPVIIATLLMYVFFTTKEFRTITETKLYSHTCRQYVIYPN